MVSELLQQVRLLDPASGTDRIADILITDGTIQTISGQIDDYPADTRVLDCQGWVLGPGLQDLYSHSGEPGFETRETLVSLAQAAAAGGFTRVAILPDTLPVLDTAANLAFVDRAARVLLAGKDSREDPSQPDPTIYSAGVGASQPARLQCWGALTQTLQGQSMTELAELADAGAIGFTDGRPLASLELVRRLLEYVQPLGKPVALWPCDRKLAGQGAMREGFDSIRLGIPGNPAIAETSALAALLECIDSIGTPTHLMRISTARSVELVRAAKERGLPITASTPWMHLLLSSEDIGRDRWQHPYNPNLHLDPPLGNPADRAALLDAVKEGVIDAVAIDHAPYTYEEKTVAFADAPPGAIGLELALPLLWQSLVETGSWSALDLWRCLSTGPAACLQQATPPIVVGTSADLTLFNPQASWTVEHQTVASLSSNTPWWGKQLVGRVVKTWMGGA